MLSSAVMMSAAALQAAVRMDHPRVRVLRECYGGAGSAGMHGPAQYAAGALQQPSGGPVTGGTVRLAYIGYLFPVSRYGVMPLDLLINLVGEDRRSVELTWTNTNAVPRSDVWVCTNMMYTTDPQAWQLLASGVSSPFVHPEGGELAAAFYRLLNRGATSAYDVGKYDITIPAASVAWIAFPFVPQVTADSLQEWLAGRFEARPFSSGSFPAVLRQERPGAGYESAEYYIDDWGSGETNFFGVFDTSTNVVPGLMYLVVLPTNHGAVYAPAYGMVPTNAWRYTVAYQSVPWIGLPYPARQTLQASGVTNLLTPPGAFSSGDFDAVVRQHTPGKGYAVAEYYVDDYDTGTTNFFVVTPGDDMIKPELGFYLYFAPSRRGTNTWDVHRPY